MTRSRLPFGVKSFYTRKRVMATSRYLLRKVHYTPFGTIMLVPESWGESCNPPQL